MSFYIERADGAWLASLEDDGPGWTRDPEKAWKFEQEMIWPAEDIEKLLHEYKTFSILPISTKPLIYCKATGIIDALIEEELATYNDLKVVEHEFREGWTDVLIDKNYYLWMSTGNREYYRMNSAVSEYSVKVESTQEQKDKLNQLRNLL